MIFGGSLAPFVPSALFSDLLVAHLPNAILANRTLRLEGVLPLWNDQILAGMPFSADPLSGMWYPPMWLTFLWPSLAAFGLLFVLHLGWGGLGMARLMERQGLSPLPATVAGLAFSLGPKMVGHIGLGHVGLIAALSWTPWLLMAASGLASECADPGRGLVRASAPLAAAGALTFLADPRWVIPAGVLCLAFLARGVAHSHQRIHCLARGTLGLLISGVWAMALAAVLLLPLAELASRSTRGLMNAADAMRLSLPPENLMGMLLPQLGANPEWMVYAGWWVVLMALLGVIRGGREARFWTLVVLVSLLLGLGENTPIYPLLLRIATPLRWMRVPPRWIFVAHIGLAVLAGNGFAQLEKGKAWLSARRARLWLAAWLAASLSLGMLGWMLIRVPSWAWIALSAYSVVAAGVLLAMARRPAWRRALIWAVVLLLGLDLFWVGRSVMQFRDLATGVDGRRALLQWLAANDGRVLDLSFWLPQDGAADRGIKQAGGVHPLALLSTWQYMAGSLGYDPARYSVTLPPLPEGDPISPHSWTIDASRLGRLNVTWILAHDPLPSDDLHMAAYLGGVYVYRNAHARGWAWIQEEIETTSPWRAVLAERRANQVVMEVEGPGWVVVGQPFDPGWRVLVDGERGKVHTVDGLLPAVWIEEGRHRVQMIYSPTIQWVGLALTGFGMVAFLGLRRRGGGER
jgi:hypothetical protein